MKLAAVVAALLLAPSVLAAPGRAPELVTIAVGHDRAMGFVAGDGLVVTVAHVVGDEPITADGRPATVVRVDERSDLALLRVPGVRGERPRFGGGDATTVLGRPAPVVRRIRASVDGGPRRAALELRARGRGRRLGRAGDRRLAAASSAWSSRARVRARTSPTRSTASRALPRCSAGERQRSALREGSGGWLVSHRGSWRAPSTSRVTWVARRRYTCANNPTRARTDLQPDSG